MKEKVLYSLKQEVKHYEGLNVRNGASVIVRLTNYNLQICDVRRKPIFNISLRDISNMPLLDTRNNKDLLGTFISDLVLQILSYVAEQERSFIKQRQKEGIDSAKVNGVKFGRPKIEKPSNYDDVIKLWKNKKIKSKEAMEMLDLKPNTFYNLLKE